MKQTDPSMPRQREELAAAASKPRETHQCCFAEARRDDNKPWQLRPCFFVY